MNKYVVNAFIITRTMTNGAVITQSRIAMGVQPSTTMGAQTLKTEQIPDSLLV